MEDRFGAVPAKQESVRGHFCHLHFWFSLLQRAAISSISKDEHFWFSLLQHEQQSHPSSWMASETGAHCPFQRTGHQAAGDTLNNFEPTSWVPWILRPLWHESGLIWLWRSLENAALHHCHMALFILGDQALFSGPISKSGSSQHISPTTFRFLSSRN